MRLVTRCGDMHDGSPFLPDGGMLFLRSFLLRVRGRRRHGGCGFGVPRPKQADYIYLTLAKAAALASHALAAPAIVERAGIFKRRRMSGHVRNKAFFTRRKGKRATVAKADARTANGAPLGGHSRTARLCIVRSAVEIPCISTTHIAPHTCIVLDKM